MLQLNTSAVSEACDKVSRKVTTICGTHHGSAWLFDQCMRAFDSKALPAQAITFSVFFNSPVMLDGEATIYRDGRVELRTV
ncbi:MAG: hypothetical protein J6Y20_03535 [Lachnospiraceae bacterium]|nr:hypothetical protein [Lachnospiraceae bacterium]